MNMIFSPIAPNANSPKFGKMDGERIDADGTILPFDCFPPDKCALLAKLNHKSDPASLDEFREAVQNGRTARATLEQNEALKERFEIGGQIVTGKQLLQLAQEYLDTPQKGLFGRKKLPKNFQPSDLIPGANSFSKLARVLDQLSGVGFLERETQVVDDFDENSSYKINPDLASLWQKQA